MSKIRNIAEGWFNYIKARKPKGISPELEAMAEQRSSICNKCPFLQTKAVRVAGKAISKYRCGKCGCAFPMMVYAPQKKCPINKWPKQNTTYTRAIDEVHYICGHTDYKETAI